MTTTVNEPKKTFESKLVRVIGSIAAEPTEKTGPSGKTFMRFPIIIDSATGAEPTWWNASVPMDLVEKIGAGFFSKWRYAKFVGQGTPGREWTGKDGKTGKSNDILVNAIDFQDGTSQTADKKKTDEDAPF